MFINVNFKLQTEIVVFAADNCNTNTQNDPCVQTNALLKPCNATISKPPPTSSSIELRINKTSVASCACNQQFYNTLSSCAQCMSTTTLDVHVRDLSQYKDDCSSFGTTFLQNAPEPTPANSGSGQNIVLIVVFVTIAVIAVGIVASLVICQLCRRRKRKNQKEAAAMNEALSLPESHFSGNQSTQNRYAPSPYSNPGYGAPSPTPPPQYSGYPHYSNYPSYQ
ncbi:14380_t:CDS:2 [Cetraspora pellucida]|uniref:14380_t:CDS:1 n=1 Tax=Cetraspora pellucida TaxID=1433469 RepID=A0A9N8W7U4_9GLOM|nr:14380_t:CDS:2 [Cetraspora pellucida]